jgi:cytoskeleton protein RodZ
MLTGNAGGLEISVDGSVIPDLGPEGSVRRNVAMDAESLKAYDGRR